MKANHCCPHCQSSNLQARGKRLALYPVGLLQVIPLGMAMLHQVSTPYQYRCNECGTEFAQRTTLAKVARVLLYVTLAAILLLILAAITLVFLEVSAGR